MGNPEPERKEIMSRWQFDDDSDAIVFKGPSNVETVTSGIHFPTDREFDWPLFTTTTAAPIVAGTYANCGSYNENGVFVVSSANSQIITYPNGTQVLLTKCEVVQHITGR